MDNIMRTGTPILTTIHPPSPETTIKRLTELIYKHGKEFNMTPSDIDTIRRLTERQAAPVPRTAPMTIDEIKQNRNDDNYVDGIVAVALCDVINNNLAGFLDIISEKLVGSPLLMDVNYEVVGTVADYGILIRVVGDVSSILDMEDNEEN